MQYLFIWFGVAFIWLFPALESFDAVREINKKTPKIQRYAVIAMAVVSLVAILPYALVGVIGVFCQDRLEKLFSKSNKRTMKKMMLKLKIVN